MVIASSEQKELIGYSTAPNYHVGRKPEWTCVLSYAAFAESPAQGQVPVLRDTLQTKSGREREALPRKGVLHWCGAH